MHMYLTLVIQVQRSQSFSTLNTPEGSVTRLSDLLDFGPIFKAFGNN